MNAKEVLVELKTMGNASTKRMLMNNHGVKEPCFGVKIGDMKKLVKRIKMDHQIALDLYDTGNYDAMYLAGGICSAPAVGQPTRPRCPWGNELAQSQTLREARGRLEVRQGLECASPLALWRRG